MEVGNKTKKAKELTKNKRREETNTKEIIE